MGNERASSARHNDSLGDKKPVGNVGYYVIATSALVGLAVIWLFCLQFIAMEKDRVPAFIGFGVNYLILMAMFVQAHITQRQWEAMREGLNETQNMVRHTERAFEMTERPIVVPVRAAIPSISFDQRLVITLTVRNEGPVSRRGVGRSAVLAGETSRADHRSRD